MNTILPTLFWGLSVEERQRSVDRLDRLWLFLNLVNEVELHLPVARRPVVETVFATFTRSNNRAFGKFRLGIDVVDYATVNLLEGHHLEQPVDGVVHMLRYLPERKTGRARLFKYYQYFLFVVHYSWL